MHSRLHLIIFDINKEIYSHTGTLKLFKYHGKDSKVFTIKKLLWVNLLNGKRTISNIFLRCRAKLKATYRKSPRIQQNCYMVFFHKREMNRMRRAPLTHLQRQG